MSAEWAAVALSAFIAMETGFVAYLLSKMREETLEERDKLKEWVMLGFVSRREWEDYKHHQVSLRAQEEHLRNIRTRQA